MATQQSIDHLVGLAVAMLGVAPGTKWLNERAKQLDGGATLADIANEIQSTSGFEGEYPAFLTDERFAKEFLEALLGDNVTDTVMMAAVDFVAGQLAGATRGELALALVDALTTIAREGEDNALHADFGKAAAAFHNKVMVAKHYTEEAREADPSASVLEGVTDDPATVMAAKDAIDNPPVPPESMEGRTIELTRGIDIIEPGDGERDTTPYDDIIVARPVTQVGERAAEVLNPSDRIDGGDGDDTIYVYGVERDSETRLVRERIANVENLVIDTVGGIDADLTRWEGLESVQLDFFGDDKNVKVVVDDGATISSLEEFGGDEVTLVGASGAVDIEATGDTAVHIGSAGQTESVKVKGGASVLVDNGAGRQSQTVTTVSVDGVRPAASTKTMVDRFKPKLDSEDFLVDGAGLRRVTVDIDGGTNPANPITAIKLGDEKEGLRPLLDASGSGDPTPISVALAADDSEPLVFDTTTGQIRLEDGRALPSGITVTVEPEVGTDETETEVTTPGSGATFTVRSNAIETVALHNSTAIALVYNNSKMDDGKDMPEDLAVTVNKYGTFKTSGAVKDLGKLCIDGAGSAENITIDVAGASAFDLASNKVKTLAISGDARLVLDVNKFKEDVLDDGASRTLETVTVAGAGGVSMTGLSGMAKLEMIDASGSSGNNTFRSREASSGDPAATDELAALTTVKGGSGDDSVTLRTKVTGKLESVDTGDGNDTVTIAGMLRNGGLEVDLGAGDDTYSGRMSNGKSRIDGGEGADILHLTSAANSTYRDADNKVQSIYTGFETLNVALGSGDYDVEQLGIVNDVLVTASTADDATVTLENMADGMGIRVHGIQGRGDGRSTNTTAIIIHESADGRRSDSLDVHLAAFGRNDTRDDTRGEAILTLTTDAGTEVINISSNATPHSSDAALAANRPVAASHYENKLTLTAESTVVEELVVSGNAKLEITVDPASARLDEVDARENSGGVTFAFMGTAPDTVMELSGGSGADNFTGSGGNDEIEGGGGNDVLKGGAGDDKIEGGAGGDTLTGGAGDDKFVIRAVSDSQLSFNAAGTMARDMDTIMDFKADGARDVIVLPKSLFDSFQGTIKGGGGQGTADVNTSTSRTALKDHLEASATKNGFFETETPTSGGFGGTISKHSVAVIRESDDTGTNVEYTWIFIDIDADGDLDLSIDHAIRLTGDLAIGTGDFMASS